MAAVEEKHQRLHTIFGKDARLLRLPEEFRDAWSNMCPSAPLPGWPAYSEADVVNPEYLNLKTDTYDTLRFINTPSLPFIVYFETCQIIHTVTLQCETDSIEVVVPLDDLSDDSMFDKTITWKFDWKLEETSEVSMKTIGVHTVATHTRPSGETVLYVDLDTQSTEVTRVDLVSNVAFCKFSYEPASTFHHAGIRLHVRSFEVTEFLDDSLKAAFLWSWIPKWMHGRSSQELNDVLAARSLDILDSVMIEDPTLDCVILPTLPVVTTCIDRDISLVSFYPARFSACLEKILSQVQNWIVCQCLREDESADAIYDEMTSTSKDMVQIGLLSPIGSEISTNVDLRVHFDEEDNRNFCYQLHDMAVSVGAVELCKAFELDGLQEKQTDFWRACEYPPWWLKYELWLDTKNLFIYGARFVVSQILDYGCMDESLQCSKLEIQDRFVQCLKKLGLDKQTPLDPSVTGASRFIVTP